MRPAAASAAAAGDGSKKRTRSSLVQTTLLAHAAAARGSRRVAAGADEEVDEDVIVTDGASFAPRAKRAKPVSSAAAASPAAATLNSVAAVSLPAASASSSPADDTADLSSSASVAVRPRHDWSYHANVVPVADRARLYAALVALVNPEPGRIFVYGAEHQERRLTGVYARRAGGFKYSGTEKRASGEWPPVLEELHAIASRIAGEFARSTGVELGLKCEPVGFRAQRPVDLVTDEDALAPAAAAAPAPIASAASAASPASSTAAPFWDTVLINHYRDGNDCISWHSDKDGAGATIASFSLGATREFHIRRRPARGQAKSTSSKSLELHKLQLADGSLLLMLPGMQDRWHHSLPPRKGMPHGRINVTFRAHGRQQNEGPQTVLS